MTEGIQLLTPPDSGWVWVIQEVNIGGNIFWATIQQREPELPPWYQVLKDDPEYGQGVSALLLLILGIKRFYPFLVPLLQKVRRKS